MEPQYFIGYFAKGKVFNRDYRYTATHIVKSGDSLRLPVCGQAIHKDYYYRNLSGYPGDAIIECRKCRKWDREHRK